MLKNLRIDNNLMGMKNLQFAFTEDDHIYMPHMYDSDNWVCYTGTHDNNTTIGWFDEAPDYERNRFLEYTQSDGSQANWAMLSLALSSKANGSSFQYKTLSTWMLPGRMNTPGQADKQWGWRLNVMPNEVCERIRLTVQHFGR